MGKFIRLDSAITDLTAPILPHAAGVAGYDRRFIMSHIQAPVGTVLSQIAPSTGTAPLKNVAGTPKVMLQQIGAMKYAEMLTGAVDGGRLWDQVPAVGSFSYAAVIRHKVPTDGAAGLNNVLVRKHGNGVLGMDKSATGVYSDSFSTDWVVMSVNWNADTLTYDLYVNGVGKPLGIGMTITPNTQPGGLVIGSYGIGQTSVAEIIAWPRTLTGAEHQAVFAALKSQYPAIA